MFILAGILGNMFTYIGGYSPYSLGASGCICGLLGAVSVFYYRNKRVLGEEADYGTIVFLSMSYCNHTCILSLLSHILITIFSDCMCLC